MPASEPKKDPLEGHGRYQRVKYLNSGSFGYVVLAKDIQTGENVAIKFVQVEYVSSLFSF